MTLQMGIFSSGSNIFCNSECFQKIANKFIYKISTADDWAIINDKLNIELEKITDWLKLNKLSLNVKKTKYMIFSDI